jgi:hypothetical protein
MNALPWLLLPDAQLLGGLSPGYWLVRLRTGTGVRTQCSGPTGATNRRDARPRRLRARASAQRAEGCARGVRYKRGGSTEAGNSWGTRNTPATACAAMAFCIIVFLHGSRFQRFPAPRGTA